MGIFQGIINAIWPISKLSEAQFELEIRQTPKSQLFQR